MRSASDLTWRGFKAKDETEVGIMDMLGRLSSDACPFLSSERDVEEQVDNSVVDSFATTIRANVSAIGGAVFMRTEEDE